MNFISPLLFYSFASLFFSREEKLFNFFRDMSREIRRDNLLIRVGEMMNTCSRGIIDRKFKRYLFRVIR